ncbi:hypothetical protein BGW80DRAFT_1385036 [Lactifluus volemus]|nr:hypothetical protein BGW80DRAFT_1385036 [Lactifluus volemus]
MPISPRAHHPSFPRMALLYSALCAHTISLGWTTTFEAPPRYITTGPTATSAGVVCRHASPRRTVHSPSLVNG